MTPSLESSISPSASDSAPGARQVGGSPATRHQPVAAASRMVFVVDDDPMMAALIAATVQTAGYRVRMFTDGTEADALAATMPPDIALVDLTMPRLSGAETIARLRKLQPELPVLVISGLTKEEARAAAPDANGFLEKPFEFGALLRAVAGLGVK